MRLFGMGHLLTGAKPWAKSAFEHLFLPIHPNSIPVSMCLNGYEPGLKARYLAQAMRD